MNVPTRVDPAVDLDARGLKSWIEPADPTTDDGDLVLIAGDGDVAVRITTGAGGTMRDAVDGLERLATVALMLAGRLRRELPTTGTGDGAHGPWTGPGVG